VILEDGSGKCFRAGRRRIIYIYIYTRVLLSLPATEFGGTVDE
jgi:hypothetical protein